MMRRLVSLCVLLAAMAFATASKAQTISQPAALAAFGGGSATGQSFTATLTGTVTRIDVRSRTTTAGATLRLYNGANGSGTVGVVGAPAYSQTVALTDAGSDVAGFSSIVLTTPFPVTAGQTYSLVIQGASLSGTNTDPYAGGTKLDDFAGASPAQDIAFQIFEILPPPIPPVPTLSEWAMILLGLSLAGGAALVIQQRRFARG